MADNNPATVPIPKKLYNSVKFITEREVIYATPADFVIEAVRAKVKEYEKSHTSAGLNLEKRIHAVEKEIENLKKSKK